jgi:hypothetical protein
MNIMTLKCSQCGYLDDIHSKCRCSRYSVPVEKDSLCVDCDELEAVNAEKWEGKTSAPLTDNAA